MTEQCRQIKIQYDNNNMNIISIYSDLLFIIYQFQEAPVKQQRVQQEQKQADVIYRYQ